MRNLVHVIVAVLVGAAGCSKHSEGPPPTPGPASMAVSHPPEGERGAPGRASSQGPSADVSRADVSRPHGVPLTVSVAGPAAVQSGDTVTLRVSLKRLRPGGSPAAMRVELPRGVTLVSGSLEERIPPGELEERELVVRVDDVPTEPLRVVAEIRGKHHGVRATNTYLWGRPEPQLAQPRTSAVRRGGRTLTNAVELD